MEIKCCIECGEFKWLNDFYGDRAARDGHRPECKACSAARRKKRYAVNREREIERVQRWRDENPEHYRTYQAQYRNRPERKRAMRDLYYRRTYGMTADEVDAMFEAQGGSCAICMEKPTRLASLHLDHDHETGAVRGVLCLDCNQGLGKLRHDSGLLRRAIAYLDGDDPRRTSHGSISSPP